MATELDWLETLLAVLILIPLVVAVVMRLKGKVLPWAYLALGLWLGVGVLGLSLYKQSIFDHYLGFLNPVPYILFGSLLALGIKKYSWLMVGLVGIVSVILVLVNLGKSPLLQAPNRQLQRTQEVAKFLIKQAGGKPFNFALIAEHNYDAAYQYYLDIYGFKPAQLPFVMADQLLVVCEDAVCQPVGHPKYEIAAFGWTKIESEQNFDGVKVFKLVHNISGKGS